MPFAGKMISKPSDMGRIDVNAADRTDTRAAEEVPRDAAAAATEIQPGLGTNGLWMVPLT
jgi:hypothetical protein